MLIHHTCMYMWVYIAMVTLHILHVTFQVSVGAYISEPLSQRLVYVAFSSIPLEIIIPIVAGSVVVVVIPSLFIICCLVLLQRKTVKKLRISEREWIDMIAPRKDSGKPEQQQLSKYMTSLL